MSISDSGYLIGASRIGIEPVITGGQGIPDDMATTLGSADAVQLHRSLCDTDASEEDVLAAYRSAPESLKAWFAAPVPLDAFWADLNQAESQLTTQAGAELTRAASVRTGASYAASDFSIIAALPRWRLNLSPAAQQRARTAACESMKLYQRAMSTTGSNADENIYLEYVTSYVYGSMLSMQLRSGSVSVHGSAESPRFDVSAAFNESNVSQFGGYIGRVNAEAITNGSDVVSQLGIDFPSAIRLMGQGKIVELGNRLRRATQKYAIIAVKIDRVRLGTCR